MFCSCSIHLFYRHIHTSSSHFPFQAASFFCFFFFNFSALSMASLFSLSFWACEEQKKEMSEHNTKISEHKALISGHSTEMLARIQRYQTWSESNTECQKGNRNVGMQKCKNTETPERNTERSEQLGS